MSSNEPTIEEVLSRLTEYPARIAASVEGLTPVQLRARLGPDEWSINDVLAHLRSCADVWGKYINLILTEDRPKIRAVSPRTWIKRTDYPDLEFAPSFEVFKTQRTDLLNVLQTLPRESWSRAASVKMIGKVMDRTVLDYATRLVIHERDHVTQMGQIGEMLRGQGQSRRG